MKTEFRPEELEHITRVEEAAQHALSEGWKSTKLAMAASSEEERTRYRGEAHTSYSSPVALIAEGYLIRNTSAQFHDEMAKQLIGVHINLFDLDRRMGDLENAKEKGELTLEAAASLGHRPAVMRAGNFLNLVLSEIAYRSLEEGDIHTALSNFITNERTYSTMGLSSADPKDSAMPYANRSANHLNIVRTSKRLGAGLEDFKGALDAAHDYAIKALERADLLETKIDRATWKANAHHCLAEVAAHRGDHEKAVSEYTTALEASEEGAAYNQQAATIQMLLAYTLATMPEQDLDSAREHHDHAAEFFESSKSEIHVMYRPQLDELRDILAQ